MRILYIITRAHPGGAQSHVIELIRGLCEANDIGIVVGEEGYLCDEAAKVGANIYIVPELTRSISPYRDLRAIRQVRRAIEEFHPDVVHAHCSKAGLVGRLAAWMCRVPSVYTAHGWRFAPGVAWAERLVAWPAEWFGARLGRHVITVSSCDLRLAARYRIARADQVTLIYNGISNSARPVRNASRNEIKIVMVARFAPPKDQLLLMQALQRLPHQVRLMLVGDGPTLIDMQKQAAVLGVAERVAFLGSRTDVAEILAESDLFVLASNSEGLPISIIEALRAGLPVVTTDVGGVRDSVMDSMNGWVVPRGDVSALREAIGRLASSPSMRISMGDAGRRIYEGKFTAEEMVRRTCEIYSALANQSRIASSQTSAPLSPAVEKKHEKLVTNS